MVFYQILKLFIFVIVSIFLGSNNNRNDRNIVNALSALQTPPRRPPTSEKEATSRKTAASIPLHHDNNYIGTNNEIRTMSTTLLDEFRDYEILRSSDLEEEILGPFFEEDKRNLVIWKRLFYVAKTLYQARQEWNSNSAVDTSSDAVFQYNVENNVDSNDNTPNTNSANSDDELRERRLCESVASLGPLAVKLGQTLSQRPDLVGVDVSKALKRLQTQNIPFNNQLAYAIIHESFQYYDGPLSPEIAALYNSDNIITTKTTTTTTEANNHKNNTLFRSMTIDPIACASLGQVYRATLHDGREVAIKVQRPDALSILAQDAQCFRKIFRWREFYGVLQEKKEQTFDSYWSSFKDEIKYLQTNIRPEEIVEVEDSTAMTEQEVRASRKNETIASILDRVARDVRKELDYRIEAKNGKTFEESLDFLGFVRTPEVYNVTDRILITEWIDGYHLSSINNTEDGLKLVRMAVEACTASMVLTGFVHADPHEGNIMLSKDGKQIVFLDFGLMTTVDRDIMEGMARGITALLSENWVALTEAFVDIGFVTSPLRHRFNTKEKWTISEEYGLDRLAYELEDAMKGNEGGLSRFGALATILNQQISPRWLVFTPPYVLLLVRTFLTLEGIAASVDPDFNIYEMALPFAIQRSISPTTKKGINVFRSTILQEQNHHQQYHDQDNNQQYYKLQWERMLEYYNQAKAKREEKNIVIDNDHQKKNTLQSSSSSTDTSSNNIQKVIDTVLASPQDGKALRRIIYDIDTVDVLSKLSSKKKKKKDDDLSLYNLRPITEQMMASYIDKKSIRKSIGKRLKKRKATTSTTSVVDNNKNQLIKKKQQQQQRWKKRILSVLLQSHIRRSFKSMFVTLRLMMIFIKVWIAQKLTITAKHNTRTT